MNRVFLLLGLSGLTVCMPLACVYDGDQRCGPHQTLISNDRCECDEGFIPGPSGCVACGDHERDSNGACVCVDGYARATADATCTPIPAALGATCDSETMPCADGPYPVCHVTSGTSGYCTKACSDSADCDGGYKCHEDGADSYCRRPPLGFGDSCNSNDDCASGEATFCETIQSHLCLVPCGAGKTDACFEGEVCCNFVLFDPICVPGDACTSKGGAEVN